MGGVPGPGRAGPLRRRGDRLRGGGGRGRSGGGPADAGAGGASGRGGAGGGATGRARRRPLPGRWPDDIGGIGDGGGLAADGLARFPRVAPDFLAPDAGVAQHCTDLGDDGREGDQEIPPLAPALRRWRQRFVIRGRIW
ncbi:MAG TPA: hypothetical protein EYH30_09720 [Anaerolineales bacterium]|nr:hypothetical protein [Anaerolineales bacterium]